MYLDRLLERNQRLVRTAVRLHQTGQIPPNTFVIDLNAVAENAAALVAEAERCGVQTYIMTKQYARNPYVTAIAQSMGLGKIVAVDMPCAVLARRYGLPVGHIGHLEQIPHLQIFNVIETMKPEVITIYNIDHARWISEAAVKLNVTQDVMIRVFASDSILFTGQEGGFHEDDVTPLLITEITSLSNIRLVGVTSFPCAKYNHKPSVERLEITPNLQAVLRTVEKLRVNGVEVKQINAPGNTSTYTIPLLASHGATHVEPGHALTGTTPNNAFHNDSPEYPAYVYVTEVSHHVGDKAYGYGGGIFHDGIDVTTPLSALVGNTIAGVLSNRVDYIHAVPQIIDYHMILSPGSRCNAGDTVLACYRTQMQMTRSYVAVVGVRNMGNEEAELLELFDHAGTALDRNYNPIDVTVVKERIENVINIIKLSLGKKFMP